MDFLKSFNDSPAFYNGVTRAPFLRLVLAEAASYGMPAQVIATIDDIAAILGFYDPMPESAVSHITGPMSIWRTDRRQPTFDRVTDVESLALKQRCLIAFNHAPDGHMVGTAEILVALGNCHEKMMPPEYYEIFTWAAVDVHQVLSSGRTSDDVRKEKGWKLIVDDDVIKPGGRLHKTYVEIASSIRREIIAAMKEDVKGERGFLRPFAERMVEERTKLLESGRIKDEGLTEVKRSIDNLRRMYPDIAEKAGTGV